MHLFVSIHFSSSFSLTRAYVSPWILSWLQSWFVASFNLSESSVIPSLATEIRAYLFRHVEHKERNIELSDGLNIPSYIAALYLLPESGHIVVLLLLFPSTHCVFIFLHSYWSLFMLLLFNSLFLLHSGRFSSSFSSRFASIRFCFFLLLSFHSPHSSSLSSLLFILILSILSSLNSIFPHFLPAIYEY